MNMQYGNKLCFDSLKTMSNISKWAITGFGS